MNKVRTYAGYAGIGFIVGYFTTTILSGEALWLFSGQDLDLNDIIVLFILVISPMLGGVAGGILSKKWWGAVVGGVIADILGFILVFASLFWYPN